MPPCFAQGPPIPAPPHAFQERVARPVVARLPGHRLLRGARSHEF